MRGAGAFAAVSIRAVKRLVCHFLIFWLALLSGGAYAHAAADAAQELGHIAAHALEGQLTVAGDNETSDAAHEHGPTESCGHSNCGYGHAAGMLPAQFRSTDANVGAPLPTPQAWASRELPNSIERPKWSFATPSVVNL